MNTDRYSRPGESAQPDLDAAALRVAASRARNDGVRRARRASNWTAALLLACTGATVAGLASQAAHAGASTASSTYAPGTSAHGAHAPQVSGSVVTSGGSGAVASTARLGSGSPGFAPVARAAGGSNN